MQPITFITWNQKKADYLSKYLWIPLLHKKIDLDELQSLELREIVEHKVKQAYTLAWVPVLVEDVSLTFHALWRLPGPFIKFFVTEIAYQDICDLLSQKDRTATASCGYGYFDGNRLAYFEWSMQWTIAESPGKDNGYWWDRIFIPEWYVTVKSELSEEDYKKTYLQIKPIEKVREFLLSL